MSAQAKAARVAAPAIANASARVKNAALEAMAQALEDDTVKLCEANAVDVEAAKREAEAGALKMSFVERLTLTPSRVASMASALREVAALPDPVGEEDAGWERPNGLRVAKRRIPLGVIGIIYEARPNVTSDAAGLCLKSGNAVVLKGGRRALNSNRACVAALRRGLSAAGLPADVLQFIDTPDRSAVRELLAQEDFIDLVIPRGGESLIRFVSQHARMPVIKHYKGVCHVVLDASARAEMATEIVLNAKVQRPSVCNAAETLLIHRDGAQRLLPVVGRALVDAGVRLHLDAEAMGLAREQPWFDPERCVEATEEDFHAEYLSLDLAVGIVPDLDAAMDHIRRYGSEHTEALVTESYASAERFVAQVHSSVVVVNASTRFADGGQLGLGAEIGISTTKLHAFGPMGLRELTTTKFVVRGQGQVRG